MSLMIRHGKNRKGQRNRTLATLKMGDMVYFGISRCNLREDRWDKQLGAELAKARIVDMMSDFYELTVESIFLTEDELAGAATVEDIKDVVIWFRDVLQ